jgi:hypothetical protein
MAGASLILKYQWRAFWRRAILTGHRAQFYLSLLAVFGWLFAQLPAALAHAARELSAGQTSSMEALLLGLCVLWIFVLVDEGHFSLSSQRLLRYPLSVGLLLRIRAASLFCSPITLLVAVMSSLCLYPFGAARQAVAGGFAAVVLFASTLILGMTVSHLLNAATLRKKLFVPAAIIVVTVAAAVFLRGDQSNRQVRAAIAFTPAHLVTLTAVADTPSGAVVPLLSLLAIGAAAGSGLLWSFRRSVYSEAAQRVPGRGAGSVLRVPGRFGGLVRKEQRYLRTVLDLWLGLLLVLAVTAASVFASPPAAICQAIIVIVFLLNANATLNCLGLDTAEELHRYFILPLRGREILLVKNVGLMVIVAAQVSLLILTSLWHIGPVEAGVEIVLAAVLLLGHLTWGNMASVTSPVRMRPYRFAPTAEPITAVISVILATVPGLAVIVLLQLQSRLSVVGIVAIVVLTTSTYAGTLHFAGKRLEERRHIISQRLS